MIMNNNKNLGIGIVTLSILNLISFLGIGVFLVLAKTLNNTVIEQYLDKSQVTMLMCMSVVLLLSIFLILAKKKIGVYVYFGVIILSTVYSVASYGLASFEITGALLPLIYAFLIYKKWNVFK